MKKFLIRLKSWEYWPLWVLYFPVFITWLFYSFKLKSLFFFSTVNPRIELAGLAGSSKMGILNQIPKKYLPNSLLVLKNQSINNILLSLVTQGIQFPCIVKPDVGERGLGIQVCKSVTVLENYLKKANYDFIIQDIIQYEIELSILYHRFPNKTKGMISSVCEKEFLTVVGNGKDNIYNLMKKNDRAFLQIDRLKKKEPILLEKVLNIKEKIVLEPIGNHCRGTIFLDKTKYIDTELIEAFNSLCSEIPALHFGRFDLKCKSLEDLKKLQNFSIIEINGVAAEPAHIYQPGFSFVKAQKILLKQWFVIFTIAKLQMEKGVKPINFISALSLLKKYRRKISFLVN